MLSGQLRTDGDNQNPGDSVDPTNQVRHPAVAQFYLCWKLSCYKLILLPTTNTEIPPPVFFDTIVFGSSFC